MAEWWEELPVEVWRGSVKAWHCDEMGHQSSTVYFTQALEGLSALLARFGATVEEPPLVKSQHIVFRRELRAGGRVHSRAGALAREAGHMVLQSLVDSETGVLAATFLTEMDRDPQWAETALCRYDHSSDTPFPAIGIGPSDPPSRRDIAARTASHSALGCLNAMAGTTDVTLVQPDTLMDRIADATRYLSRRFERAAMAEAGGSSRFGTAVVECRCDYHMLPRGRTPFVVYSAFTELNSKTRRVAHWMFDDITDTPICTIRTLEVNFDLDLRKSVAVGPGVNRQMAAYCLADAASTHPMET